MKRSVPIAVRLGWYGAAISVAIGIVMAFLQIISDYSEAWESTDELIDEILSVAQPAAAQATHRLDRQLAEEVASGLLTYPFIVGVDIVDDLEQVHIAFDKPRQPSRYEELAAWLGDGDERHTAELIEPLTGAPVGNLSVTVSMAVAMEAFYLRSGIRILLGILSSLVIFSALSLVYHRLITRPVVAFARSLQAVDMSKPAPIVVDMGAGNRSNELGQLSNSTNIMLVSARAALRASERSRAALAASEARLRDIVHAASDWFWETDAEGRLIYLSDRFTELSGQPNARVLGNDIEALVKALAEKRGDERNRGLMRLAQAVAARAPFRDVPSEIVIGEESKHVTSNGVPIFGPDGGFRGMRCTTVDRTDLVLANEERLRLAEELAHVEKLRAIGQLTGGVAHDFNNLLAVFQGNFELIDYALQQGDLEEIPEHVMAGLEAVKKGSAVTNRLLSYARKQPLNPRQIEPQKMIQELEVMLRPTLGDAIELEIVVGGGVWQCCADSDQLTTVLLNLAINARDAMPEGGRLTLEVFNTNLDQDYTETRRDIEAGQYVCFAVTDNGVGMTDEIVEQAFDPFFTTKEINRGSGLGLSMAYGFSKQSGGHIAIYSEPGEGTTVKVYLPRSRATSGHQETPAYVSQSKLHRTDGSRVLVVDDNESVRQILVAHLESIGCRVLVAGDGAQALAVAEGEAPIDILLLDVVLPGGLNGRDLSETLLQRQPAAKVVFMSGYTENAIIHHGRLDPDAVLLQKPFTKADLIKCIEKILGG